MRTIDDFRKEFTSLVESPDTPEHLKSLLSCILDSFIGDSETWKFIYDIKDNLSSELASVFEFFVKKEASLKWFMLLFTVYEEKIEDAMPYMRLFEKAFDLNVDVEVLDNCQRITADYKGCEEMLRPYMEENEPEKNMVTETKEDMVNESLPAETEKQKNNNSEYAALKRDNESLSQILDAHMKELTTLRAEIIELQKESFEYKRSSLNLESELDSLRKGNQQLMLTNRMSEKKLISIQKLCDSLKKMNAELSATIREAENHTEAVDPEELAKLKEELARVQDEYQNTLADKTVLESTNEHLNEQKNAIDKKYQALFVENRELKTKCRLLEETIEQLKEQKKSSDMPSEDELERYASSDAYSDDFLREMNEELRNELSGNKEEVEVNDYDPRDLISMQPDEQEIKTHRSFFRRLIDQFKDREFTRMPVHEQEGRIFTKLVEREYPKETIKLISETLRANKKMERVELYHMVERNASPADCEKYLKSINAA